MARKKPKSSYRRKGKTARWLDRNRNTREGQWVGWLFVGAIGLIIYGIVKLIEYLGTILYSFKSAQIKIK